jgi:polyisoprenoid-binding protein YceI
MSQLDRHQGTQSYTFGAANGTVCVLTTRVGAAAMAGHDLVIDVTSWEATLELGDDPSSSRIVFDTNAGSFRVREGTGGIKPLTGADKTTIEGTIVEILGSQPIRFRSTALEHDAGGGVIRAHGELELVGATHPVAFEVLLQPDGRITARAAFNQTDWGIKPYRALFGALQVADEINVTFDALLS